MNISKTIGENVRGCRKRLKWTQEKLAGHCGFHSQYISRLELGHEQPSLVTLGKLAKELKVEIHLLLIKDFYKTL